MLSVIIFEAVFLPTLIYAIWRGGKSERAAILMLATAFTATPLLLTGAYARFETSMLIISGLSFLSLLGLAALSEKFWPMWVAALQGLVVISHVAPLLNNQVSAWTYYVSNSVWSYPQLLLVAVATWEHQRYWQARPAETV